VPLREVAALGKRGIGAEAHGGHPLDEAPAVGIGQLVHPAEPVDAMRRFARADREADRRLLRIGCRHAPPLAAQKLAADEHALHRQRLEVVDRRLTVRVGLLFVERAHHMPRDQVAQRGSGAVRRLDDSKAGVELRMAGARERMKA